MPELVGIELVELDQVNCHQDDEEAGHVQGRPRQSGRFNPGLLKAMNLQEAAQPQEGEPLKDDPGDEPADDTADKEVLRLLRNAFSHNKYPRLSQIEEYTLPGVAVSLQHIAEELVTKAGR